VQRRWRRVPGLRRRVDIVCCDSRRILLLSLLASCVPPLMIDRIPAGNALTPSGPALPVSGALHHTRPPVPIDNKATVKSTIETSKQKKTARPRPKSASGGIPTHCCATHSLEWSYVDSS
jgi:hypothetical protein